VKPFKVFVKTTLVGGLIVVLPVALLVFIVHWGFGLVTGMIQPLTDVIVDKFELREVVADVVVIALLVVLCFLVGALMRTGVGKLLYRVTERRILKAAPGYSMIKETVVQFLETDRAPFRSVALVQISENEVLVTAFITDSHPDGSHTVFVPNGPNPLSGNIYHVKGKYVHPVDIPADEAMRSVISCGAGSKKIVDAYMHRAATARMVAPPAQPHEGGTLGCP
jgi:uncharacterized membrane protein